MEKPNEIQALIASGISHERIAAVSGVCAETVRKWELGRTIPNSDARAAIYEAFGILTPESRRGYWKARFKKHPRAAKINRILSSQHAVAVTGTDTDSAMWLMLAAAALTIIGGYFSL